MPSHTKNSRWMVERERHGLLGWRPDAPFMEAMPVGDAAKKILGAVGVEMVDVQTALREEWAQLVGEDNAARTRPGAIEGKVLTIFVKGQVWYSQLKVAGLGEIQKRVVARFGRSVIQRVTLRPES